MTAMADRTASLVQMSPAKLSESSPMRKERSKLGEASASPVRMERSPTQQAGPNAPLTRSASQLHREKLARQSTLGGILDGDKGGPPDVEFGGRGVLKSIEKAKLNFKYARASRARECACAHMHTHVQVHSRLLARVDGRRVPCKD